jgi:5-methylcytosine-specific restriction endonuclease McrBC regulatory subunit McrC
MEILERRIRTLSDHGGSMEVRKIFRRPSLRRFDEVESVPVRWSDFGRCTLGRLSPRYKKCLDWAKLLHRGIGDFHKGQLAPALAIDSNGIFELFAESVCRKAFGRAAVKSQYKLERLLEEGDEALNPTPKPDFVIKLDGDFGAAGDVDVIGDAKYKDILREAKSGEPTDSLKAESVYETAFKAADLYQLYAYMRMTNAPKGFFVIPYWDEADDEPAARLFPENDSNEGEKSFQFRVSPLEKEGAHEVFVLALNLMKDPIRVQEKGAELLKSKILNGSSK